MNTTYLLPCSCGRKIAVQLRQAGETVKCECGNSIDVPTLSNIKKLERFQSPAEPKTVQSYWTFEHGLIFAGGLVILVAIGLGGWLYWSGPADPYANFTPEQMIQGAATRTPIQSLRLWQALVRGGLEHHKRWAEVIFTDIQAQYQVYWWILGVVVGIGVALVAAGIIVLNLKKRKPGGAARV
ncbi:MAG: hypothetical protein ABSE63_08145 [Thermoguttaceae bacterium]